MLELSREEALQLVQHLTSELANPSCKTVGVPGLVKDQSKPAVVDQNFDAMSDDEYGDLKLKLKIWAVLLSLTLVLLATNTNRSLF